MFVCNRFFDPRLLLSCVMGLAALPAFSRYSYADIIYSNTGIAAGGYLLAFNTESTGPWTTWGDHATLGSGPRMVRDARVELIAWGTPGQQTTLDVAFMLYADDEGSVGSLLMTSTVFSVTLTNRIRTFVSVPGMNGVVGNSVFAAVAIRADFISGELGNEIGGTVWSTTLPTIGYSNYATSVPEVDGFGLPLGALPTDTTGFGYQNLRFELAAIPEPNPIFLLCVLLGMIAIIHQTRRCIKQSTLGNLAWDCVKNGIRERKCNAPAGNAD